MQIYKKVITTSPTPNVTSLHHLPGSFRKLKISVSQTVSSEILGLELLEICFRCIFLGYCSPRPADPNICAARSPAICMSVKLPRWFSRTFKSENQCLRRLCVNRLPVPMERLKGTHYLPSVTQGLLGLHVEGTERGPEPAACPVCGSFVPLCSWEAASLKSSRGDPRPQS